MEAFLKIIGFVIFAKLFLFWLWLWQLKEYHIGRFLAHFETQAFAKIISGFWRLKYPKFTKKISVVFFTGIIMALLTLKFDPSKLAPLYIFTLIIFVPLLFQIITVIWRKWFLRKAIKKRESFKNLLVIGITGSYGKTSTKEFLYTILASKWENKVLKTNEHQNSEMGIARFILNELRPEHEIFIVEMGAYNRGGIKLLCKIAKPKIGILTGINEQHMSTFGSLENIIKAKYELIESLPSDGMAFFNAKNEHCLKLYDTTKNVNKFLYGQKATFFGEENIMGAMAIAKELGMRILEIEGAVGKIENKMPGIKIKEGTGGLKIVDSTYSANPDGVIANLEYIRNNFNGKRKVIVMPCLIELGKASKEVHQRIGKKIAEICDLAIITTKDRFLEIKEGAASVDVLPDQKCEILFIEDPKKISEKIKGFTKEGDKILLESRVPKELIRLLLQ